MQKTENCLVMCRVGEELALHFARSSMISLTSDTPCFSCIWWIDVSLAHVCKVYRMVCIPLHVWMVAKASECRYMSAIILFALHCWLDRPLYCRELLGHHDRQSFLYLSWRTRLISAVTFASKIESERLAILHDFKTLFTSLSPLHTLHFYTTV